MKYKQDKHNANRGTRRGQALVEKSLRKLGAGRSIVVDKHGTAIAGNKTLAAAEKLGLAVLEVETDGSELVVVKRSDLDLSEPAGKARLLAYADNRAGEIGLDWDASVLAADAAAGLDLGEWDLAAEKTTQKITPKEWDSSDLGIKACFVFNAPIEMQAKIRNLIKREYPEIDFAEELIYG